MAATKPISIVIADDHTFFREGLIKVIQSNPAFQVVGEASNGEELVTLALQLEPDIIILDISMPIMNGIEVVKALSEVDLKSKIILLTMRNADRVILQLLQGGVMGYLDKSTSAKELYEGIKSVAIDNRVYFPETSNYNLMELLLHSNYKPFPEKTVSFTERELEVIEMICNDFTTKEIGARLYLSPRTIDTHRVRIMERMNVKSVAGLVAYAFTHHLVSSAKLSDLSTIHPKKN